MALFWAFLCGVKGKIAVSRGTERKRGEGRVPHQSRTLFAACFVGVMIAAPAPALPRAQPPAEPVVSCTAISVWDGDGPVACREGWKLRLHGVAARELSGECRPGHPCPAASGIAARDALVALLGGAGRRSADGHILLAAPVRLRCTITGGSYGRLTGWCTLPDGRDLSCAMVASGTALRWDRHWGKHPCHDAPDRRPDF